MAKLYGIGVGPGDSELLTLKAVRVIQNCEVIVAPAGRADGDSIALATVKEFISENTKVMVKHFPMGGDEQERKISEAFLAVKEELDAGKDVVFLTIGDPFIYSTYIYLLKFVRESGYEVETVPGITSFCASASAAGEPLVIGDEPLLIVPGNRVQNIKNEKHVVVMKVYKNEEKILNFLEEKGFDYVYVKKAGREGQEILRKREDILNSREYMSLIIGRRK